MMRILATLLLAAGLWGTALAQGGKPVPREPQQAPHNYQVYAQGLTIETLDEGTLMTFSGGVRIEGRGLLMYADELELGLRGDVLPLDELKKRAGDSMEELPDDVQTGGGADDLAQAARGLELPKASFRSDSVRRLKATGHVRFEGQGVTISTASVESSDGGLSWDGRGRTTISSSRGGEGSTSISADSVHFDSVAQLITARGNIGGSYRQAGMEEALALDTDECSYDMDSGIVSVPGEVRLNYGGIDMRIVPQDEAEAAAPSVARELAPLAPPAELPQAEPGLRGVTIDLPGRIVRARGRVQVDDPERGIALTALNLDYMMDSGLMMAWQVELSDVGHGMTLSAPLVEMYTQEKRLVASGMPVLRYLSSSYTGERISVAEGEDDLLVIEVEGQQLATLNLEELKRFGDEGGAGS